MDELQQLQPVAIDLAGRVEDPGDSYPVTGHLECASYEVGAKAFQILEGIDYDVVFTNTGEGILATGIVRASAEGECDRCLDPAYFEIAGEIEEYYLFEEPEDSDAYEDGYELLDEDRIVDLSGAIADAVVIDTPFVVLCKPDCKGLCPTCGANLNYETCDCAERAEQERIDSDDNPFAVLKDMKFDE